jgi:exonuclease VII small subunit
MDKEQNVQALKETIAHLEADLAALKVAFPAHSLPPAMLERLDDLDEQLQSARAQLAKLTDKEGDRSAQNNP